MNPFTESTVARPLSEPRRRPANDPVLAEDRTPPESIAPDASEPPPKAANERRRVRDPRSVRLARRKPRRVGGLMPFSLAHHSVVTNLSHKCRRGVAVLLGLGLALGVSVAGAVNVNSAGAQELETVTGIGPKTAQTILAERERGGRFESLDDLAERVKGIGPKKAKSLQAAGLTVGQGGSAPKAPVPAIQRKK